MSNSITGRIVVIGETENIPTSSGKVFQKRLIVIETDDRYPQRIPIEFAQAHVDVPVSHSVGDRVEVFYDLQGRKWNEKYFLSARGWKIAALGANAEAPEVESGRTEDVMKEAAKRTEESGDLSDDDLPF